MISLTARIPPTRSLSLALDICVLEHYFDFIQATATKHRMSCLAIQVHPQDPSIGTSVGLFQRLFSILGPSTLTIDLDSASHCAISSRPLPPPSSSAVHPSTTISTPTLGLDGVRSLSISLRLPLQSNHDSFPILTSSTHHQAGPNHACTVARRLLPAFSSILPSGSITFGVHILLPGSAHTLPASPLVPYIQPRSLLQMQNGFPCFARGGKEMQHPWCNVFAHKGSESGSLSAGTDWRTHPDLQHVSLKEGRHLPPSVRISWPDSH